MTIDYFESSSPTMTLRRVETHPLQPFLPYNARLLILGSFPPPQKRWSMDFFYPNFNNDMWRISGLIFYGKREYFLNETKKAFCKEKIIDFLIEKQIALFDTATVVCRINDNASDKFLKIVQPTNVEALLSQIPQCTAIAATGQKSVEILMQQFCITEPKIGEYKNFMCNKRQYNLYRMPSSSRAYPLKLEKKAEYYEKMFEELDILK
jgi:G:T/U-mismatch repair DNA glycosylase